MINNLSQMPYKMKGMNPRSAMQMLIGSYSGPAVKVPQPNKYYTFVYQAKTPNIQYDAHPVISCGDVFAWGFTGFNVHWGEIRRYTWNECVSPLFEIAESEIQTVSQLPIAKYV